MPNPLAAHPPWRQIVIMAVALPIIAVAAVLAFAFPNARTAPRDLPVGVVGAGPGATALASGLAHRSPGAFDLRLYADETAARQAIEHREIYGAFAPGREGVTVLTATAAGPAVATVLVDIGHTVARGTPVRTVDVVASAPDDTRGSVLGSAVLPLTLCGMLIAGVVAFVLRFRPAWRQLAAIAVIAAVASIGLYLVIQGFLGALPGEHLATWASIALVLVAISASVAGLVALAGTAGIALGGALMVFVGNPFSGATSAPELLPSVIGHLGQWFPPGAAASLLRSTAYFHGHGAGWHVTVLAIWAVLGVAAIVVGHLPALRFAASPQRHGDDRQWPEDVAERHGREVVASPRDLAPTLVAAPDAAPAPVLAAVGVGRHERLG